MIKKSLFTIGIVNLFSIVVYGQNENNFERIAKKEFLIENSPEVKFDSIENAIRKSLEVKKSNEMQQPADFNPTSDLLFGESAASYVKPSLERRNYNIEDAYVRTNSGRYVAKNDSSDSIEDSQEIQTPSIPFLIILGILLIVVYKIAFNNRDKSQDYKLTQEYKSVSNEGKVKLDILSGIDKLVKEVCKSAPQGLEGLFIKGAINDRCDSLIKNKSVIAVQNKMSVSSVVYMIEECRKSAINYYIG